MSGQPSAGRLIAYGRLLRRLHSAGFSRRAADVLAFSDQFTNIKELRDGPWQDDGDRPGLRTRLMKTPGCGPAVMAEVEAYRQHGDPRKHGPQPVRVAVELDVETTSAVDRWIAARPVPVSRAEAMRLIIAEALSPERRSIEQAISARRAHAS